MGIFKTSIENGVPIKRRGLYSLLDELEIGQSVLLGPDANKKSILACVQYRKQRYGKKYATRTVEDGYRVWRVE